MGWACGQDDTRNVDRILTWKPLAERPIGRPIRKLQDDIQMDFEIGSDDGRQMEVGEDCVQQPC